MKTLKTYVLLEINNLKVMVVMVLLIRFVGCIVF